MSEKDDVIHLWMKQNKKGVRLSGPVYRRVAAFILAKLIAAKEKTMLLVDLLEEAEREGFERIANNISWYILQVKLDLEARRLVNCSINREKSQEIRLNVRQYNKQRRELARRLGLQEQKRDRAE